MPSISDRMTLPHKSVRLQCLDEAGGEIKNAVASGFICQEKGTYYLYTCWHVVTGYDRNNIKINGVLPRRASLQITLQSGTTEELYGDDEEYLGQVRYVGGTQTLTVDLYHSRELPFRPAWYQAAGGTPNIDLNNIGIRVPQWADVVKIPLPQNLNLYPSQVVHIPDQPFLAVCPGDQLFIVGFPYGYSASGDRQPTPIVIVRNVAATVAVDRGLESLLDGAGAAGMSGGPVFALVDDTFQIAGIYTGLIYPDHVIERNERTTALGTYSPIAHHWARFPLKPYE